MTGSHSDRLRIQGESLDLTLPARPEGMVFGRESSSDVHLPDPRISRKHARLFRDPLGRWVVEDLESHNGIYLEGRRVPRSLVAPGEQITMGPFRIRLEGAETSLLSQVTAPGFMTEVLTDPEVQIVLRDPQGRETLTSDGIRLLNQIGEQVAGLRQAVEVYPAVCEAMACAREWIATVLRLTPGESPAVLAYREYGKTVQEPAVPVRLSRRVLDSIGADNRPVAARGGGGSDGLMVLTQGVGHETRMVCCAPINCESGTTDVLYVDGPAHERITEVLALVTAVARQAHFAIRSLLLGEARTRQRLLEDQLSLARKIQEGILPRFPEGDSLVDLAYRCRPALWVGGDYCDLWEIEAGQLAFLIGDVTGHGLAAAMVMVSLHAVVRTTLSYTRDLSAAMDRLHRHFCDHMDEEFMATLFLGVLDKSSGCLEYVNAGHPQPRHIHESGEIQLLGKPTNPPISVLPGRYASDHAILGRGEALVLFTDGLTECKSQGVFFGEERLSDALTSASWTSSKDLVDRLFLAVDQFRDSHQQEDDMTVLCLARREA